MLRNSQFQITELLNGYRAAFIDADTATAGHEIKRVADEGLPVVLVADDGSTRVLRPEAATR